MGPSWGPLGALLGPSWGLLGASLGPLGSQWPKKRVASISAPPLEALLAPSWGHLGPSWGHLGAVLGPSWGQVGPIWGLLGPLWGPLEAAEAHRKEKAGKPKNIEKNIRFFDDFGLLGASLAGSVAASGRLVAIRTPHGGMLQTMWDQRRPACAIFESLLGSGRRLWGHLGPCWAL